METLVVAKKILTKGRLARRTTLLPLDKMQGHVVSVNALQVTLSLIYSILIKLETGRVSVYVNYLLPYIQYSGIHEVCRIEQGPEYKT